MFNSELPTLSSPTFPIPPYRYSLPIFYIRPFNPRANPYPGAEIWEVVEGMPEQQHQTVYIDGYGELTLSKMAIKNKAWQFLTGRNPAGVPMIILAVKKTGDEREEDSLQTVNGFTRLLSLFTSCMFSS